MNLKETTMEQKINDDPLAVFELIKEKDIELVDKLLAKKIVSINTCDEHGNNILVWLLKLGCYDLVSKYMDDKSWDVNNQNNDGNTFAHYLVKKNYVDVKEIFDKLKKNKDFLPNIKNNLGKTILDESIEYSSIYTTIKILEDKRFTSIDIVSFKHLYDTFIKSNKYGKYSKLSNLESIITNLSNKQLHPNLDNIINFIIKNFNIIKDEVIRTDKSTKIDILIKNILMENNA